MSRKSKIDPIIKVKIVEQYLAGEIGLNQVFMSTENSVTRSLKTRSL